MKACSEMDTCNKNVYNLQWSSSLWPAPNLAEGFIEKYMGKVDAPPVEWRNVLDANETQMKMMRDNVVAIKISGKEPFSNVVVEYASYPLITLMSDIGGILGLYMGMSVLSLCELFESIKIIPFLVRNDN